MKYEHDPSRGFFNLFQEKVFSEKINIQLESIESDLQIKEIFRKIIRPKEELWQKNGGDYDDFFATLSIEERLIYLAIIFDKSCQKGSVFHFLWHKTEWIIAFGQALKILQISTQYTYYQQVILETTGFELENTPTDFNGFLLLDLHPDGSRKFDSVKVFDKEFEANLFFEKMIEFCKLN